MYRPLLALALALTATATVHAQVSLNSVRVVAKDAGGTVMREASQYGTSGIFIAFVTDPEGNQIELIQPARR